MLFRSVILNPQALLDLFAFLPVNYLSGGLGFNSFNELKAYLGPAGQGKAWHHIVEQNQINNSGFALTDIHNTKNAVAIESGFSGSIHTQISGYYGSIQDFTGGSTVRGWLSGQSFEFQFEFGLQELGKYGTVTPTSTGWVFTPLP